MQAAVIGRQWDHILSSPRQRCLNFAHACSVQKQIPLSIDDAWQEINFGDWEGKTAEQIDPEALSCFYQNPLSYTPNNAEPYLDFKNRINKAWNEMIQHHAGQHVLIITHAGVIRSLFNLHLNLPLEKIFNLRVEYASYTRFQCISQVGEADFIQLVLPPPSIVI